MSIDTLNDAYVGIAAAINDRDHDLLVQIEHSTSDWLLDKEARKALDGMISCASDVLYELHEVTA